MKMSHEAKIASYTSYMNENSLTLSFKLIIINYSNSKILYFQKVECLHWPLLTNYNS